MTSPETRTVNGGDIDGLVDADQNRDVLRYVLEHQPSCHSDPGEALIHSAEKCGDWIAYSPSFSACRYVVLIAYRRIFALGLGQRSLCYRLPKHLYLIALQTGATAAAEVGPDWVRFELYRSDWPAPDLPFWALKAYAAAREDSA